MITHPTLETWAQSLAQLVQGILRRLCYQAECLWWILALW
jgi:hypothetical protein